MERSVYNNMRVIERDHWWFRGRREILTAEIARLNLPPDAQILEVGCGTGGNLPMLAQFGHVTGLEPDDESRSYAEAQTGLRVVPGTLPDGLPGFPGTFDMVAALDVVEHLDADGASLVALRSLLKPNGVLLTTVPAHPWMWSEHDVVHHHKRRYRKLEYIKLVKNSGFQIARATYFNSALFPVIAAVRAVKRGERTGHADDALPSPGVNVLLNGIFGAEKHALRHFDLPFGVSLLVVARPIP